MNTKPLLVTIGALLLLAWVPAGLAQDAGTVTGTITAKESGCPDGKFYCWGVSLDGEITPGATVELEVVNPASNRETHNLYLKYDASYNGETTDGESADENTADLSPGDSETLTFTVPEGTESIYYWCDIPIHEVTQGMWGEWDLSPSMEDGSDGGADGADGGEEPQGSPGPGLLIALAGLGAGAALLQRRD